MPEPKTILIAEDDIRIREVTREFLEKAGYRVVEADTFQKAFVFLEENEIGLALVSEHLPNEEAIYQGEHNEDTYLLLRFLRDHTMATMKLIILTCNDPGCLMKGLHADRFLRKPFNPQELIRLLKELLP